MMSFLYWLSFVESSILCSMLEDDASLLDELHSVTLAVVAEKLTLFSGLFITDLMNSCVSALRMANLLWSCWFRFIRETVLMAMSIRPSFLALRELGCAFTQTSPEKGILVMWSRVRFSAVGAGAGELTCSWSESFEESESGRAGTACWKRCSSLALKRSWDRRRDLALHPENKGNIKLGIVLQGRCSKYYKRNIGRRQTNYLYCGLLITHSLEHLVPIVRNKCFSIKFNSSFLCIFIEVGDGEFLFIYSSSYPYGCLFTFKFFP